ncbi:Carboxylesterase, partial [Cooperia oncophora]
LQFLNIVGQDEARCLTLNVFSPRWAQDSKERLAVMVWIHGGGFSIHSSSNYGDTSIARNLCAKDVIVVSVNYRLGPLGFFTTGDDVRRGYMGLWDQTLALRWVHDNISAFGGDPGNVTVFGQSAGGASADLLAISPHSRDLFHRVIPMAGCGECDFAMRTSEAQATLGREYARYLGWTGADDDTKGLMHFMEAQPSSRVGMGVHPKKGFRSSISGNLLFVPNFDGDFFPKPMSELRRESPRKTIMTGTTQHEGLFFVALGGLLKPKKGLGDSAGASLKSATTRHDVEELSASLMGDYAINVGVLQYARKMSECGNNVYFYCFDYFNPDGFGFLRFMLPYKGSTHCSELRYVLGKGIFSKFKPNHEDLKMLDIMTAYFTNFAKYGNPNGDQSSSENGSLWELYDPTQPYRHLHIQLPTPVMADDYQKRRMELWDKILQKNRSRARL